MKNGVVRGLGLPCIWALTWAIPGGMIEALSNVGIEFSFSNNVDMWPQTLGIPGFVAGVVFVAVIAASMRILTFESWSLGLQAGLGAIVGIATAAIIMAFGWIGGTPTEFAFTTVMGGIAAVTSALLLRRFGSRRARAAAAAD